MSEFLSRRLLDELMCLCLRFSVRKIFAPGEEENLELEEEEDAAAGAGSAEAFPPRAPGTVNQTHPLFGSARSQVLS